MQRRLSGVDSGLTEYGDPDFSRYLRRAFLASAGFDADDLARPVVGIAHTSSDYVTCHRQMPELVEAIARGVSQAGGLPLRFPVMALGEPLLSPTSMLFRNLAAMSAEELIRAQPMDAVVLVGGCDKTVPALLMAAVSAGVPALLEVAGPMGTGSWRGQRLGACTDCRRLWADHRAGGLDEAEIADVEQRLAPNAGTCMVMGTASTMACVSEALGFLLPGGATPPAASGERLRHGVMTGRAAVGCASNGLAPAEFLSGGSFRNAFAVLAALGGSANAIVHLLAIARRAQADFDLDAVARILHGVPPLVDVKPVGGRYMDDFDHAGGVPELLRRLRPRLDLHAVLADGRPLGDVVAETRPTADPSNVVRTLEDALGPSGALRILRGSLAPAGAVIKAAAASRELLQHEGPAVVFDGPEDVARRIDDPDLPVTERSVLVMRNAGPVGAGMPEAGALPIPRRLVERGVRDLVRVSDARMSGTAYGTVVLHVAPEAAVGGPLALVRDGDPIRLDVEAGRIDVRVDPAEMERRRGGWSPPSVPPRGWRRLYAEQVRGAQDGADLEILTGDGGS